MVNTIPLSIIVVVGLLIAIGAMMTLYPSSNSTLNAFFLNMQQATTSLLSGPIHGTAQTQYMKTTISVKNTTIIADLALTPDQQTRGLSGRERLGENQGMLFVFKTPGNYGFWMKEMKFPLDIFWIDANHSAVYIKENLPPCPSIENCPTYFPDVDAPYVLEMVAGFAQRHGITNGTHFDFKLPG